MDLIADRAAGRLHEHENAMRRARRRQAYRPRPVGITAVVRGKSRTARTPTCRNRRVRSTRESRRRMQVLAKTVHGRHRHTANAGGHGARGSGRPTSGSATAWIHQDCLFSLSTEFNRKTEKPASMSRKNPSFSGSTTVLGIASSISTSSMFRNHVVSSSIAGTAWALSRYSTTRGEGRIRRFIR